ncbi:Dead deah box rna [Globisporangium polare]
MAASNTSETRLEQHMRSKFAAERIYSEELIQKATLPTRDNLTMAYVIHESENESDTTSKEDETRVVLIMGYSYRKEEWAPMVDAMMTQWEASGSKSKLKLLSFDNRGVGHSDAPWGRYSTQMMAEDTLALMDHLGWTTAHIVGTSMGGMISQELALMTPKRVQSLSLVVSARGKFCPAYSALGPIIKSTSSSDVEVITSCVVSFLYPEAYANQPIGDSGKKTMRDVLHAYHKTGSAARGPPVASGALGQSSALIFHFVSDERLLEIRDHGYPILIVGAKEDQAIDVSHAHHFQKMLTGDHVTSKIYDDAGHAVFLQHIDEVASDILGVIRPAK